MKPVSARVFLTYRCKCGCEWDKTPREVKILPGFICDNCQAFCKFDPVSEIIVKTVPKPLNEFDVYRKASNELNRALVAAYAPKPVVEKPKPKGLTEVQKESILALVALGFKTAQATAAVKSLNCNTVQEYITQACGKNHAKHH